MVGGLRDLSPLRGGEAARVPVRVDVRVGLHHEPGRCHWYAMVFFGGGCGSGRAAGDCPAGDAPDAFGLPGLRIIQPVVEHERTFDAAIIAV